MKKCIVLVKPFKLADVLETLSSCPIQCLTMAEVRGYGLQKGHLDLYTGSEYKIKFLPKTRLEFYVHVEDCQSVLEKVVTAAKTGRIGDGKIFIIDTENLQLNITDSV
ncbi:P-II family nitrogen regulator [Planctomycetota bacterium]